MFEVWSGVVQGNGICFLGYGATLFLGGSGIRPQYAQKTNAVPLLICALCKVAEWVGVECGCGGCVKNFCGRGAVLDGLGVGLVVFYCLAESGEDGFGG